MQEVKLTQWSNNDPSYTLDELMPGDEEVFFKTIYSGVHKGEHWKDLGFECENGVTFEYHEIKEWQPVLNDL